MTTSSSQKIGVWTATIVGMNAMIGAGILTAPSTLAGNVGPACIATYAFVALAVWCMAQSISRVAQLYPQEGSFYTYAKQWGGHIVGLLTVALYLVGLITAMGLLTHQAGLYLAHYIPQGNPTTLGGICIIALTLLNMFGVSLSTMGQQILIVLTVVPLIATTLLCFSKASLANLTPFAPHGITSIFQETRRVAFAFFGFEAIASLFTIIKDPQKNLPRAITYSLLAVAALYLLFVTSLILAVPLSLFSQYPGPVSDALLQVFPNWSWIIEGIHLSFLFAILGTVHSMIWASGMLLLSFMKKIRSAKTQKLLTSGIVNQDTCTLFIGAAIFISFISLTSDLFFNFTTMPLIAAYICAMITLLTLKSEWKSGQNIITLAGIGAAVLIFYFALDNCRVFFTQKVSAPESTISSDFDRS